MNIKPVINIKYPTRANETKIVANKINALENKCEFLREILQNEPFNTVLKSDLSNCMKELNKLRRMY